MLIGSKELFYDTLPSTNSFAAELIKDERPPEGTIIMAGFQTGGRGQMGNHWESEAGKNLLISVILYPVRILAEDQFMISMAVSLALCDFSDRYISSSKIKWPNDIYVNDDKIAGILIENALMGNLIENCVAGIGYNVNQKIFTGGAPNPVSLCQLSKKEYDLNDCYNSLKVALNRRYKQLLAGEFKKIHKEYTAKLYRFNEWHYYEDKKGRFAGRIISIAENGLLIIERKSGKSVSEYSFKELEFII